MQDQSLAVHRTVVAVDVEGFGHPHRTDRNQVVVRDSLYQAMQIAFHRAGIPWRNHDHEDRGDGLFILVGPEVPKSLFVESLPAALASALRVHNRAHSDREQIRLRMALHAGEIRYDRHGATAAAINLTFRLLESEPVKAALAGSPGVLAVIASSWFYEEVVRHSAADAAFHPVPVAVKETKTTGWICLPDHADPLSRTTLAGRDNELALLTGLIKEVTQGRGSSVLIEGEPGIGKSALVRTAVAATPQVDCQVFRGAGDELGQTLPLLPFLDGLQVRERSANPRRATIVQLLRGEIATQRGTDMPAVLAEQLLALIAEQCAVRPT